jgi:hypothetical protein
MAETIGQVGLRAEVVDKTVKGFAVQQYKFKPQLTISSTNAWNNTFYTEDPNVLSDTAANRVKGVARGANFPQASVSWTKQTKELDKYAIEDNIFWEDVLTDNVDVQARTMFRIAERITKGVDDEIYSVLSQGGAPTTIGSVIIGAGSEWNGTVPMIIDNLMEAKQKIGEKNYNTDNLVAFISPLDHRSMVNYLAGKGAQFPQIGTNVTMNGGVGNLCGINLIVSNSVTGDGALVMVPKIAATWKEAYPLSTETIIDPMKSVKIRACELGVTQLTDPSAIVYISGTQV